MWHGYVTVLIYFTLFQKHGLKTYARNPSSYTPLRESAWQQNGPRSLTLGSDALSNKRQIAMFSKKDAEVLEISVILTTAFYFFYLNKVIE